MKRFFSILALIMVLTACDDGDLQEVSFEFDDSSAQPCNKSGEDGDFFIFKTTDQRALILQLSEKNFANTVTSDTLDGTGIRLDLVGANRLIYRVFSEVITEDNICSAIPPTFPVVTEERIASNGKVLITTATIKSDVDANGATRITNYRHTVTFSDVTFDIGDGNQRFETFPPIVYERPALTFADFDVLESAFITCTAQNPTLIVERTDNQALSLKLSEADAAFLFSSDTTTPKTRLLSTENTLTHEFFGRTETNPLSEGYFCNPVRPFYPNVQDTWIGTPGGIIEVVTSAADGGGFNHIITFRNVQMQKNSQNFLLKSAYVFGTLETPAP